MVNLDKRIGPQRTYKRSTSVVFRKTNEEFGGLSNMAAGYPIVANGEPIRTSEALYQACRFPDSPEVQRRVIAERSPMAAKMKSKKYRAHTRSDWKRVRIGVMRWCLRVKLAQNWEKFSALLLASGTRPIVEESRRDTFWGARPLDQTTLSGINVLGRLLMELRERVRHEDADCLLRVEPLDIAKFKLNNELIAPINSRIVRVEHSIEDRGCPESTTGKLELGEEQLLLGFPQEGCD